MERAMREQPISSAQRDEVYRRRLIAERDSLASLEASMVAGGYAEAVQIAFGEALDIVVAASDILAEGGCPSLDDYADLDDLLVSRFGQLTLLQRIELRAAFEKLGDPRGHWEAVTRDALLSVGAPVNSANQHIIYQTLCQAKSYAAAVFNARRFVESWQNLLPSDPQPPDLRCFDNQYAQTAEQPLLHLFNMSLEGYLPEPGRAPSDTATNWITNPGAQSCHARPSGDRHSVPPVTAVEDWARLTIAEAAERYLTTAAHTGGGKPGSSKKRAQWDKKTRNQFDSMVMLFSKSFPGPMVRFTQQDLDTVSAWFDRLPSNHHKSSRHQSMSLEAICAEAAQRVEKGEMDAGKIGLQASTTNRHFGFFKLLWEWVRRRVPSLPDLAWGDVRCSNKGDRRGDRDALTIEQGQAMFQLPIWTGCAGIPRRLRFKAEFHIFNDSSYWVPLIIWYSGLRREEICKLLLEEVKLTDGIMHFEIKFSETGRIKNSRLSFVPTCFEGDNTLRSHAGTATLQLPMIYLPVNRAANGFNSAVGLSGYNDYDQKRQSDATSSRSGSNIVSLAIGRMAQRFRLLQEDSNIDARTKFRDDDSLKELSTELEALGYTWELVTIDPLNNSYDIRLTKQGSSFLVSAASSGERELLTYLFAIFTLNVRNALIIVDEPELHLHPRWQTALFALFEKLSKSTGNQFVIATHSPTFISPASIQYVSRIYSEKQQSEIVRLSGASLPNAKHLFNIVNSENNERVFFTDTVVLVEGLHDRIVFERVLEIMAKNTASTHPRWRSSVSEARGCSRPTSNSWAPAGSAGGWWPTVTMSSRSGTKR
jgi:predicted ATPase